MATYAAGRGDRRRGLLASDESRFIAGAERVIDGGATASFASEKEISR